MFIFFCRAGLVLALTTMTYVVLLPAYDFSQWVPTTFLNAAHLPQSWIKFISSYADKVAHTLGALVVTCLYFLSIKQQNNRRRNMISIPAMEPKSFMALLFSLALTAELAQLWIGRSFSFGDIFAGVLGGFVALVCINETIGFPPMGHTRP